MMKRILSAALLTAIPALPLQAQGVLESTGRTAMETGFAMLAASLANALQLSRDEARREGTQPIPPHIRAALLTWYPSEALDGIEYRVGIANQGTLQSYSIRFGDALAVATIDTITFASDWTASNDIVTWAHEVKHVQQFRDWGLQDFARAYVADYHAVEAEAYAEAKSFQDAYDQGGWRTVWTDVAVASQTGTALICTTPEGACVMGVPLGVSLPCTCPSAEGPVRGRSQ